VGEGWDGILGLATFRVVLPGGPDEALAAAAARAGLPVWRLADLTPEHRQVQVVVAGGREPQALAAPLAEVLPALLDGWTFRDLRTGQVMAVPEGTADAARAVGEALQQELVVCLCGEPLAAHLVYRPGPSRFEETVLHLAPGQSGSEFAQMILDAACLILGGQGGSPSSL